MSCRASMHTEYVLISVHTVIINYVNVYDGVVTLISPTYIHHNIMHLHDCTDQC